ncbi:MAG: ABC transporter ATP-binding protein [Planctomycetota bacterium]
MVPPAEPPPARLEVRDLRFAYGRGREILGGLSFRVVPGAVLAIVGPSGCGKTTLLRLIAGLERPASGSIALDGREVARGRSFVPPHRRRVGVVFQDYALFPTMSAAGNVRFALRELPRRQRRGRAAELLEQVGMGDKASAMPHTLSGGQQQRVALARALAQDPVVMLLDEPFCNLDAGLRSSLRGETLAMLRKRGVATMLVTHDATDAAAADEQLTLPTAT